MKVLGSLRYGVLLLLTACPDFSVPPIVDRTPPSLFGATVAPAHVRSDAGVLIHFGASEPLPATARGGDVNPDVHLASVQATCVADAGDYDCSAIVPAGLADGPATITIIATDVAGNDGPVPPVSLSVDVDNTPPTLQLQLTTAQAVAPGGAVAFTASANEPVGAAPSVSGVDAAGAQLFEAAPTCALTDPKTYQCSAQLSRNAGDGTGAFTVTVQDLAGNTSAPQQLSVTVSHAMGLALFGFDAGPNPARPGDSINFVFSAASELTSCSLQFNNLASGNAVAVDAGCRGTFIVPADAGDQLATIGVFGTGPLGAGSASFTFDVDAVAPRTADATALVLHRSPLGTDDRVEALAGGITDDQGHSYPGRAVQRVRFWPSPSGGLPLLDLPTLSEALASTALPNTQDAGYPRVWLSAVDLAGNEGPRVELVGSDVTGPVGDGNQLQIVRNLGSADLLRVLPGAFTDPTALGSVQVFAPDGGALAGVQATAAGTVPDLPFGTATHSYPFVLVQAQDKAGNSSVLVQSLLGTDLSPPNVDGGGLRIIRRAVGAQDTLAADPGALTDDNEVETAAMFSSASGGVALATGIAVVSGGFAEQPLGTPSSSFSRVWVTATDKAGNTSARVEALVGQDVAAPVPSAANMLIHRRGFAVMDGVEGLTGAFDGPVATVRAFDVLDGGLIAAATNQPGAFAEMTFPIATTPARVAVNATDKAGNTSVTVEVLTGAVMGPPALSQAALAVVRTPAGQLDLVRGDAGAVLSAAAVQVQLFADAGLAAAVLGTAPVDAAGGFGDVPVGTAQLSPFTLFLNATDKTGKTTGRVQIATGTGSAPTLTASRLAILRKDFTQPDSVRGDAGAVASPICAPTVVDLSSTSNGSSLVGQGLVDSSGGFPEASFGLPDASYPSLWARAANKCGLNSGTFAAINAGNDITAPNVNFRGIVYVNRPVPLNDGVWADAGAEGDAGALVRLYADPQGQVPLSPEFATAGLGWPERTIGNGNLPLVYVVVRDKAGNIAGGGLAEVAGLDLTMTLAGRQPYDSSASSIQVFSYASDGPPDGGGESWGMYYGAEVSAAQAALATTTDSQFLVQTATSVTTTTAPTWALNPATGPTPRAHSAAAYDPRNGQLVVYGGLDVNGLTSDTWRFDGTSWTQVLGSGPPPRQDHVLVYNPFRGVMMMYGGLDSTGAVSDYWELDGGTWTQLNGHTPARSQHAATYEAFTDEFISVGGLEIVGGAQTLSRFSNFWNDVFVQGTAPPGGYGNAIAYDPHLNTVHYVRGTDGVSISGQAYAVTTFTGIHTPLTGVQPDAGYAFSMAFDPHNVRSVLFGGVGALACCATSDLMNNTWELTGNSWAKVAPTASPPPRAYASMAYDTARSRVVLFGGDTGGPLSSQIWEYTEQTPHPRWAVQLFVVPVPDVTSQPTGLTVKWVGSGVGSNAGAQGFGAAILVWNTASSGNWDVLASSTAANASSITLTQTYDVTRAYQYTFRHIFLLVQTLYPSDPAIQSQLSTDSFEVDLKQ